MKTFKKKCKECGKSFSTSYNHSKYCENHRRDEKKLKPLKDTPHSCPVCDKLLESMGTGLEKMVAELDGSYIQAKKELDHSIKIRKVPEPPNYDIYIERYAKRYDTAKGLYRKDIISIKGLTVESGYSESTVKRHVNQHLRPSKYLKKVGKGFIIGTGINYSLPRYQIYYNPDKVYRSQNIAYFGLKDNDIKQHELEFEKIDDELQLISERISILWIKTRLEIIRKMLNRILMSKKLDNEEKAVCIYGFQLTLKPYLKNVLKKIAPKLTKNGTNLSKIEKYINDIEKIQIQDRKKMKEIIFILNGFNDGKNPLLHESWVAETIYDLAQDIRKVLSIDNPIVIIDRNIGPRTVILNESQ